MMKLIALSLCAAVSVASGSSLRGDFETDVVGNSSRNLQNCVAHSSYLGCFENRNNDRALPYEVDGRFHTARECESACDAEGFKYFAREWKGQCFCGNRSDYDKHGVEESGCDCCGDDVGGNKMCVWMVGETAPGCDAGEPSAPYLGCYGDRNRDRALPYMVGGRTHSADECHQACKDKGMKYFGREWRGQCFCSDDDDYNMHGRHGNCDCCGSNVGGGRICVWHA